jgi:hypothetical protein
MGLVQYPYFSERRTITKNQNRDQYGLRTVPRFVPPQRCIEGPVQTLDHLGKCIIRTITKSLLVQKRKRSPFRLLTMTITKLGIIVPVQKKKTEPVHLTMYHCKGALVCNGYLRDSSAALKECFCSSSAGCKHLNGRWNGRRWR